jgi:hypothetical protein
MANLKQRGPLLDHLDEIEAHCSQGKINLKTIFSIFGNDGHYVLICFLILPFLQPIPLFGLSTPFGILIAIVAYFSYRKKPPVVPQKWALKSLPSSIVLKIAETSELIFEKLTLVLHPRLKIFFREPFRMVNTILLILNAILLALPLPIPFSNTIPAWMILFQALGHLEEDGLFIILSYIQTAVCLIYFGLIVFGIISGVEILNTKGFF